MKSIAEAEMTIDNLNANSAFERLKLIDLESLQDREKGSLLKKLRATKINDLRNSIVYKQAHRPTFKEARGALDEALEILLPLTWRLDLHDEPNWYLLHQ